ncbi:MAG: hypothetical protein J5894_03840 [Clostridia bacterium]|nr:hypothetical protein [Clostridia bacterium]
MKKLNVNVNELPTGVFIGIMILYSIMPVVARFFSSVLTTYAYMIVLFALSLLIIFEHGMKTLAYNIYLIVPYVLLQLMDFLSFHGVSASTSDLFVWVYSILLAFLPVMAAAYMFKEHKKFIKPMAVIAIVAVLVTAVTTTLGLYIYPDAARFLATDFETENAFYIRLGWMNVGGYETAYTLLLLYPLVIYAYKQRKIHLITAIGISLLFFICILRSQYTIALLMFIVTTVLFFMKRDITTKHVWILLAAAAVLILIFWAFFSSLFEIMARNVESKEISDRLLALSGGVDGLSNTEDQRLTLYMRSINSIISYPIIGGFWFGGLIGGHSYILDIIAKWGIFGAAALFVIYRKIYTMFYKPYRLEKGFGYVLWIFLQTIFLSIINTGAWLNVLALFVPILLCFIDNKREIKSVRLKVKE